jgi:hypothetical protein
VRKRKERFISRYYPSNLLLRIFLTSYISVTKKGIKIKGFFKNLDRIDFDSSDASSGFNFRIKPFPNAFYAFCLYTFGDSSEYITIVEIKL